MSEGGCHILDMIRAIDFRFVIVIVRYAIDFRFVHRFTPILLTQIITNQLWTQTSM